MKDVLKVAPFFLLVSYLVLCFFRVPSSSDSVIVLGLSGLFGFQLFMDFYPKDSIETQLSKQRDELLVELSKRDGILKDEIEKSKQDVTDQVTKLSMNLLNTTKMKAVPNGQPERKTVIF